MDMERIAVVGLAGRFPGASTIAQFWQNLCNGVEARTLFTEEELAATVDPALLAYPGYVKSGFVLDNIDQFDADFFRFDAQQARITDPQQRLFLECVWEALEVAGIDITTYQGLVGVYAGASQSSYWAHARAGLTVAAGNMLAELIGNDKDYLATQTAYRLNLQGPCLSVQSACSTGLVAVHLACQSLLNHECDVAVAGGVTVHVPHRVGYPHVEGSVFSADGRCCAFSAQATGMVFGNGIGVVVLKRLSEALADGDYIWAVVRGSAVNNDGARKFGFMTSSRLGQIEVITEAWNVAEVTAQDLSYIETHGSGTPIGDVIEFSALATLFAELDPSQKSCAIGSVKSNVGHLETAAGITGFIKTVLALHHRQLPPSINFATPNPDIDFTQTPLYLNTTLTPWPCKPALGQNRRYAGVSSFGIGGTNAHVVLEEAPLREQRTEDRRQKTESKGQKTGDDGERSVLDEIIFEEVVDDGIVLEEILADDLVFEEIPAAGVAAGGSALPLHVLTLSAKTAPALRELAQRYASFLTQAATIDFGDICYTAQVGRSHFAQRLSIVAAIAQEASSKLTTWLSQPEQAAAQDVITGLAEGSPKAALCFGGADAIGPDWGRVLYATQPVFRKAIAQCDAVAAPYLARPVAAFLLDEQTPPSQADTPELWPYRFAVEYGVAALWQAWGIELAGVMGQGVGDYVAACVAGVFSLVDALKLVTAYSKVGQHSAHSVTLVAAQLTYALPHTPLFAGATGQVLTHEVASASYWAQHRPTPAKAPSSAWSQGQAALAEAGIHTALASHSDWQQILARVGALYVAGVTIDWQAFYQATSTPGPRRKVLLPTYPFQRQRYWVDLTEHPLAPPHTHAPVPPSAAPSVTAGSSTAPTLMREQLGAVTGVAQQERLVGYLQQVVAQLLAERVTPEEEPAAAPAIPLTVGFAELGMTSLDAVTLRNQLQMDFGHKLPATLVLDYPTITTLAGYLTQTLLPQLGRNPDTDAPPTSQRSVLEADHCKPDTIERLPTGAPGNRLAADEIDRLSADEIAEKLAAKLGMSI